MFQKIKHRLISLPSFSLIDPAIGVNQCRTNDEKGEPTERSHSPSMDVYSVCAHNS